MVPHLNPWLQGMLVVHGDVEQCRHQKHIGDHFVHFNMVVHRKQRCNGCGADPSQQVAHHGQQDGAEIQI